MQPENSTLWTLNFWKTKYQVSKNWATTKFQPAGIQASRSLDGFQGVLYDWHDDYNYGNYDNMMKLSELTKQKAEVKR